MNKVTAEEILDKKPIWKMEGVPDTFYRRKDVLSAMEAYKQSSVSDEGMEPSKTTASKPVASHSSGVCNSIEQDDEPFWQGQMYSESKQLIEAEKLFDDNGLRLELTCAACPEQYDVFVKVGYLRLRHGEFRVDYPDCGGETIYEAEPKGDGIFQITERMKYLTDAMNAILKKLNSDKNPEGSDTTDDDSSNADDNQNPH